MGGGSPGGNKGARGGRGEVGASSRVGSLEPRPGRGEQ